MVSPDENDCLHDRRIDNALLYFVMPKYKETFILFTTEDKDNFDYDNINEDIVRLAYIYKDDNNGGYAYLKPIKDKQVLKDATDYAREYLYEGHAIVTEAREVAKYFREKLGYDSSNNTSFYRNIP